MFTSRAEDLDEDLHIYPQNAGLVRSSVREQYVRSAAGALFETMRTPWKIVNSRIYPGNARVDLSYVRGHHRMFTAVGDCARCDHGMR